MKKYILNNVKINKRYGIYIKESKNIKSVVEYFYDIYNYRITKKTIKNYISIILLETEHFFIIENNYDCYIYFKSNNTTHQLFNDRNIKSDLKKLFNDINIIYDIKESFIQTVFNIIKTIKEKENKNIEKTVKRYKTINNILNKDIGFIFYNNTGKPLHFTSEKTFDKSFVYFRKLKKTKHLNDNELIDRIAICYNFMDIKIALINLKYRYNSIVIFDKFLMDYNVLKNFNEYKKYSVKKHLTDPLLKCLYNPCHKKFDLIKFKINLMTKFPKYYIKQHKNITYIENKILEIFDIFKNNN